MIKFIRKEKTRKDFGELFDYFLYRDSATSFLRDTNEIKKCIQNTQKYKNHETSFKELLYNQDFLSSSHCDELLNTLVKSLHALPTFSIEWMKDDIKIGDNFLWTEIYEHEKIPFYYILNCNTPDCSILLINKETGRLLEMHIAEIFPSSTLHLLNGRFIHEKLNSIIPYQLKFALNESKNEVKVKDFTHTPIENIISIPEEFTEFVIPIFISTITPSITNIPHEIVMLTDEEDIKFRNRIIEFIRKEEEEIKEKDELLF
jgi:hypothetical protein